MSPIHIRDKNKKRSIPKKHVELMKANMPSKVFPLCPFKYFLQDEINDLTYIEHLKFFEGYVPYMYLDTATPKCVTIGYGYNIQDRKLLHQLEKDGTIFIDSLTRNKIKHSEELNVEWLNVSKGNPATLYVHKDSEHFLIAKLQNCLEEAKKKAKKNFTFIDDLPYSAKCALWDIAYNVKNLHQYKRLHEFLYKKDFVSAAHQSKRKFDKAHPDKFYWRNKLTYYWIFNCDLIDDPLTYKDDPKESNDYDI